MSETRFDELRRLHRESGPIYNSEPFEQKLSEMEGIVEGRRQRLLAELQQTLDLIDEGIVFWEDFPLDLRLRLRNALGLGET